MQAPPQDQPQPKRPSPDQPWPAGSSSSSLLTVGSFSGTTGTGYALATGASSYANALSQASAPTTQANGPMVSDGNGVIYGSSTALAQLTSSSQVSAAAAALANGAVATVEGSTVAGPTASGAVNNANWAFQNGTLLNNSWGTAAPVLLSTGAASSWGAARGTAQLMGGDLAVISSAKQNSAAQALAGGSGAWIGASRPTAGAPLQWVNGSSVPTSNGSSAYANWSGNQPADAFNTAGATTALINDTFSAGVPSDWSSSPAGLTLPTVSTTSQGTLLGLLGSNAARVSAIQSTTLNPAQMTEVGFDWWRIDGWGDGDAMTITLTLTPDGAAAQSYSTQHSFTTAEASQPLTWTPATGVTLQLTPGTYGQLLGAATADQLFTGLLSLPEIGRAHV